jgi:hypothetical protein
LNKPKYIKKKIMSNLENKVLVDPAFIIPQPGIEVIPVATLASIDLNGSGDAGGFLESTGEMAVGGVLVYAAYQSILTLLKSEAARKEGLITRAEQLKLVATTAFESGKNSAFTMIVCSAIVAFMPWLSMPLTILGVAGGSLMGIRIFQTFYDQLDENQQAELRTAAENAKVKLQGVFPESGEVDLNTASSPA